MSERERNESHDARAAATNAAPQAGAPARRKLAAWTLKLAEQTRRAPKWFWPSVGALALLLTVSLLYFALRPAPGWTLVVHGAPTGSDVFVDNIRRGVSDGEGDVRVSHLRAGNKLVRVAREGQGEFVLAVAGADGETKEVSPKLVSAEIEKLPDEIDYKGAMVLVAAGEFVMGADDREQNERPAHQVTLPDYYIDKYEVTNAQYKKFCEATGHTIPLNPWWTKQSLGTEDYLNAFPELPVIGVSWEDATAYARWAEKRLPTEQEWEKAASWARDARAKRRWPWGDSFTSGRANVGTNAPARVTDFASGASAYGVVNMAGNVSEWVESNYLAYEGNQSDGLISKQGYNVSYGPQYRVTRGGSFRGGPSDVSTTRRDAEPPSSRTQPDDVLNRTSWLIGFRCAVSADDPQLRKHLSERGQ